MGVAWVRMPENRKLWTYTWITLGLLMISIQAGCRNPTPSGALRVQLSNEPVSMDPTLAEDGVALRVLANLMDGLVGYDGAGKLQPRLAESWEWSGDGKQLKFKLRQNARWSDGQPVRPVDFLTSIRRALAPASGSTLVTHLLVIEGARAIHHGKSREDKSAELGVSVMGDTLTFRLEKPSPYFLEALTLPVAVPLREDVLAANGGRWPETGPVTGPYLMKSHLPDRRIVLERNPEYWAPQPSIATIWMEIVSDESTGANLFDRGELDILTKVPALHAKRLRDKGLLHTDPFLATYFLGFNCGKGPFKDRDWRRAVAGAISFKSREEVVAALDTGDRPATSWIPFGLEGYLPPPPQHNAQVTPFSDSIERVRKQLRSKPSAAGSVSAGFDSGARNALVMEKIQSDLRNVLGLRLQLVNQDWKSHVRAIHTDPPPIYRFGWMAPFRDPISHLKAYVTGDPNNDSGCSFPDYDRLVAQIEVMSSGAEREAKIIEAQRILVEREAAIVPLFHYVINHAVTDRVQAFRVNPFGIIRFDELGLSR